MLRIPHSCLAILQISSKDMAKFCSRTCSLSTTALGWIQTRSIPVFLLPLLSALSALYPLLSALCSLLSTLCSLLFALCSLLSALCSLLSTLCSLLSTLYSFSLSLILYDIHTLSLSLFISKALYVYDELSFASGGIKKFVVTLSEDNAAKGLDFKVTIAWTDPPYPSSSIGATNLLNDIDLVVMTPGGTAYWGNGIAYGDRKNSVEQVHLSSTEEGDYSIYIKANSLDTSTQKVSIVITYPTDVYPTNKDGTFVVGPTTAESIPDNAAVTPSPTFPAPSSDAGLPAPSPTPDPDSVEEYTLSGFLLST